ncbi:MAG: site-2 protease family protein, partial [Sedimentisphaerales bacterium]|nr:site-2 protease family protein [Sedimentisphaerales bacterium]
IFVHELGHFVAAKSVGIMVEAFSIGFGPVIIGIKRINGGYQVSVLPTIIHGKDDKGALGFVIPAGSAKEGKTEYRISLVPLGGFVKMLGQEDVSADKPSDDPRAFGNKAIWQRMIVISAGVVMNLICGTILFLFVFSRGIQFPPAVVGAVSPDKPAALAGIKGGDEIIAIDGNEKIDFSNLILAAALSDEGEKVPLTVRHPDGTVETFHVEPAAPVTERQKNTGVRIFGISPADEMVIDAIGGDVRADFRDMGIYPGDKVVAVNDRPITRYDQLHNVLYPTPGVLSREVVTVTTEHTDKDGQVASQNTLKVFMTLGAFRVRPAEEKVSDQILTMIPRLKISRFSADSPAKKAGAKSGDIIIRFGSLNNPILREMHEYCRNHEKQIVEMVVARRENDKLVEKTLKVTPHRPAASWLARIFAKPNVVIGVSLVGDLENPVVAHCRDLADKTKALPLPRGARIMAVAGEPVHDWKDILAGLTAHKNQEVEITYTTGDDQPETTLPAMVPDNTGWIDFTYQPTFCDYDKLIPGENERTTEQIAALNPPLKIVNVAGEAAQQIGVKKGDIILRFGDLDNPIAGDIRDYCKNPENQAAEMVVARMENGSPAKKTISLTRNSYQKTSTAEKKIYEPLVLSQLGFDYRAVGKYGMLPLKQLKRLYKGDTLLENLQLGMNRTYTFIAQTYLFLGGMFKGSVSAKAASGPVGILKMSYTVASQKSVIDFIYFLAVINICIAVFNFLPLPILDGGYIVMLLIEKIKGSPVSVKIQEIVTYAGLIMIGSFFLYVTFNDIVKVFTGQI